jgi:AcrR family transcriptional regulator
MPRTAAETRSHVLEVASELFYWRGIHATGIDLVAAKAGVAPTTLYRLFDSKDGLIAAYVQRANQDVKEMLTAAIATTGPDPCDQILAIFDQVFANVDSAQFRGCAMMMTLAEFPDTDLTAHRNAVAGKIWVRDTFGQLTGRLGVDDPSGLADDLTLILEGMLATGQALGSHGPAKRARRLAVTALSAALPGKEL